MTGMRHTGRLSVGLFLVGLIAVAALTAPLLAPYDPTRSSIGFLEDPSWAHWLGTDELGRDTFSRVLHGARTSLVIGLGAAVVANAIGVPIGLTAGYFGGVVDLLAVPMIDLFVALPGLVLALIITVMVGATVENLVLVLGFVTWPGIARLVRGQTLATRELAYVTAARALGGSPSWIIRWHVLPNIVRVIAAQFSITVSFAIFTSASLSFLGLGIPPPTPDWGGMVRGGFDYLTINPLLSLGPGFAVTLTVIGFYLMGSSVE
jgi:peptide/nickel transport system permease protein